MSRRSCCIYCGYVSFYAFGRCYVCKSNMEVSSPTHHTPRPGILHVTIPGFVHHGVLIFSVTTAPDAFLIYLVLQFPLWCYRPPYSISTRKVNHILFGIKLHLNTEAVLTRKSL